MNETCEMIISTNELKNLQDIERSIQKKFRRQLWGPYIKALKEFQMVEEGDKIAVAISGGKDSLLLAKLFQELKKDKSRNFELKFISMNPGFEAMDVEQLRKNFEILEIPGEIFDSNVWEIAFKEDPDYPCFLCAKMRRGWLYNKVEELGCNKMALGHHFDDMVETVLINMFYAGTVKTMLPKVPSTSGKMELIRPLIYIKEKEIDKVSKIVNAVLKDHPELFYIKEWSLNTKGLFNFEYSMKEKEILKDQKRIKKIVKQLKEYTQDLKSYQKIKYICRQNFIYEN